MDGNKSLRNIFKPQTYHRKDKRGNTIQHEQTAEEFARHLAQIWKSMPTPTDNILTTKLPLPNLP